MEELAAKLEDPTNDLSNVEVPDVASFISACSE